MPSTHQFVLTILTVCVWAAYAAETANAAIFARPVISRAYEQNQWVLRNSGAPGDRETAASVGAALAGLKPSYVSGLIYLQSETVVNQGMIDDWNTIRSAVRAAQADAKFDVEISLNPNKHAFASADALVAKMKELNTQLAPDGFWFDFYNEAPADWKTAAIAYAHSQNQTVGGNVFTKHIPAGSDAVAFVDKPVPGSTYGFDFNRAQVAALQAAADGTVILGHLQSNPQNNETTTESCVYIQQWTKTQRFQYLKYWASQQCPVGFTFMYPVFYPLCPGAYAYDPKMDVGPNGGTLYQQLKKLELTPKGC